MDSINHQRETLVEFVNELGIGNKIRSLKHLKKSYTRLLEIEPESSFKRVKFDLTIQQTSEGDFDEEGCHDIPPL